MQMNWIKNAWLFRAVKYFMRHSTRYGLNVGRHAKEANISFKTDLAIVNPTFAYAKFCQEFCRRSTLIFTEPEKRVVTQDERETNHMYFIENGTYLVKQIDGSDNRVKFVNSLTKGDYFGEMALIYDSYRSCSVMGFDYGTLFALALKDVYALCFEF